MASSTFKLAIIGAGGIANAHAGAIKSSGGRLALAAVVDPVEANRNKLAEAHGAKGFATIEELISAKKGGLEVHGVVVCTPPWTSFPRSPWRTPRAMLARWPGLPTASRSWSRPSGTATVSRPRSSR
jgi:shikimate 5-dehydrogenase